MNELMLILSVVIVYGAALAAYRFFGRSGLYTLSALATVFANIEVMILITAFGMEQTLGNVLFAVTFLITDILSECEGKAAANKAVYIGIASQIFFLILSQCWLLYTPAGSDTVMPAVKAMFSSTPRLILASLVTYAVSQVFDVWLYHKWWSLTEKKTGNKRKFLWLRNNGSTLISQLINTAMFTFLAFLGVYDIVTVLSIFGTGYLIYVITSLLDTPVLYLARKISESRARASKPPAPAEKP